MSTLVEITRREVEKYAGNGEGINLRAYPILDDVRQIYTVIAMDHPVREEEAGIIVLARVVGDRVIIEEDNTDKPLIDAMMQQRIPREQIIRVYADEPLPEDMVTSAS